MLVDEIAGFVENADPERFDSLARRAFEFQIERIAPYRRLCESRGVTPDSIESWREIPTVPTLAFETQELHADEPKEVFRSSGTRGQDRSVHFHPYPELYRKVVDATFPERCLPGPAPVPMLSLIPTREQAPDSSLAFMTDHVLDRWGHEESLTAFGDRGVKVPAARSWLGSRQRSGAPVLILATSLALDDLLRALERRFLHFRLPPGSLLFETGGFKGRQRELSPAEQLGRVEEFLGIPGDRVVREYGMTELTSQAYATPPALQIYEPPPWMRVRALAPESLEELPPGESGLLAFLDLANIGSAIHLLTEDLGTVVGGGFRLHGRASDADLRGCSLTVEALATREAR